MILKCFFAYLIIALTAHSAHAHFPIKNLNVIIFTADDLGADETGVGAFGAKIKGITPSIDRIAKAGVRFSNAHVNKCCLLLQMGCI